MIVIGSGFIGCEIAASLQRRGHAVTLVSDESAPNAARLGDEAAARLASWLEDEGVTLSLGTAVESIRRRSVELELTAGELRTAAPVIVMATGVAPRSELAAAAGLPLADGAVEVDAQMATDTPGLAAAGDVCMAINARAGRPLRVEHWGDALEQGAIAGRVAAGRAARWDQVPGFWSTIGERTLKYAAWGDGYEQSRFEPREDGGFVAWYGRDGRVVGVLAHRADDAYEQGQALIAEGAPWSS